MTPRPPRSHKTVELRRGIPYNMRRPGACPRTQSKERPMKKYVCKICGYVYDPADNNGVAFEDLPDDWTCPMCGVGKSEFEEA